MESNYTWSFLRDSSGLLSSLLAWWGRELQLSLAKEIFKIGLFKLYNINVIYHIDRFIIDDGLFSEDWLCSVSRLCSMSWLYGIYRVFSMHSLCGIFGGSSTCLNNLGWNRLSL